MRTILGWLGVISICLFSRVGAVDISGPYVSTYRDFTTLRSASAVVMEHVEAGDEEQLVKMLGLITLYAEQMEDDAQAAYLLYEAKEMVLGALQAVKEENAESRMQNAETEEDDQGTESDLGDRDNQGIVDEASSSGTAEDTRTDSGSREGLGDGDVTEAETDAGVNNDAGTEDNQAAEEDPVSSITPEMMDTNEDESEEDDTPEVTPSFTFDTPLDAGLGTMDEGSSEESVETEDEDFITPNADVRYELGDLYREYAYTIVNGSIPESCVAYFDQIDQIAQHNDFPTSLIIAMWWREHSCNFDNPDNGRGNFQITSHYYEPGEIVWDEFATQVQNFIDFANAKWRYYNNIQVFGPEPIALSYHYADITSIRKHSILYNGVYPDVTLESSRYSNENFTQWRDGRDGIVMTMLKVIQWEVENGRRE